MAYTNTTLISNYLQRTLTTEETTFLTTLIPAIQMWLDRALSSHFDEVDETTRYFDGCDRILDIDPCTAITAVKSLNNDGSDAYDYTAGQDYMAYPLNETVKRELVKRHGEFNEGPKSMAVTAKFSEYDGGVPQDIQTAATRIAADVIQAGKTSSVGNVQSESLEGHSVTYRNPNEIIDKVATQDPFIANLIESRKDVFLG